MYDDITHTRERERERDREREREIKSERQCNRGGNDINLLVRVELPDRHAHRWGIRDQWSFLLSHTFIKTPGFVKVTGGEKKKKFYCDFNALHCAALRGRTESTGRGKKVKEGKKGRRRKKAQARRQRPSRRHLILPRQRSAANQRKLNAVPLPVLASCPSSALQM